MINPIALAIPFFFVLIGVEALVARAMGLRVYRLTDAITDLSCGLSQQATGIFGSVVTLGSYVLLYETWHAFEWDPAAWWTWVVAMLLVDLAYYAWHRWTHEMNLGWVTHVVHHQSEDYNLAVALRQSITSSWSGMFFYLPLALLGIPPLVYATSSALNTLYQFWIHTETIGKLGPIGWIWNTPSHHRVHHATNPQYLDKNYAGVLIVWDRMFGTFEPEEAEPVYGTVKPLESYNPLWANVWYLWLLGRDAVAARTWSERLQVFWRHPGWRPEGLEPYPEPVDRTRDDQVKYDPPASAGLKAYVVAQFVPVGVAMTAMLLVEETAAVEQLAFGVVWILVANATWGGLFEGKRWALPLEIWRLVATGCAASLWLPGGWALAVWVAAAISGVWVWRAA